MIYLLLRFDKSSVHGHCHVRSLMMRVRDFLELRFCEEEEYQRVGENDGRHGHEGQVMPVAVEGAPQQRADELARGLKGGDKAHHAPTFAAHLFGDEGIDRREDKRVAGYENGQRYHDGEPVMGEDEQ